MIHEPKNLSPEQKRKIFDNEASKRKGMKISCGHDFWDKLKEVEFGDTILCECCQYFVKMRNRVWYVDSNNDDPPRRVEEEEIDYKGRFDVWLQPVIILIQDKYGNTIF